MGREEGGGARRLQRRGERRVNAYFSEKADVLLREWLSRNDYFRQSGEAEDGFWRFAVAMIQDSDGAGERLSIVEIDRRVRRAATDVRGVDGSDEVSIYRLVSQIESVYCFLDAQRKVEHRKEFLL